LIGSGIGYIFSSNKSSADVEDIQQEASRIRDNLSSQITQLNNLLEDTEFKFSDLESDHGQLQLEFNSLMEDYQELSESYDELLAAYERALGAIPLEPEPVSTEIIEKEYSWWYDGKKWTLSLNIPESLYNYYSDLNRPPTEDYSVYVTHPFDDEYLRTLIEKMNFIAISRDYTESEKVNLVISFVQSLPYTSDSVTTPYDEYPRYPLETLVDDGGDCEDTSILVSALLYGMNYDVLLFGLPGHMACGVYTQDVYGTYWLHNGREYFFLETTGEGWQIGDLPDDYKGKSAHLYVLKATPIITHDWEASWKGDDLALTVTVSNQGTAKAEKLKIYAALDAGKGYVWNPIESDPFDLHFGREITLEVLLEVRKNEYTRLIIGVLSEEGYLIDKSYSEWFDT